MSSGPKFIEPSEFIASKQATLAALEPSLRSLTASLQSASKARANVANSLEELCEAVGALEQCGLSTPAKRTLAGLKDLHEQLASTQRHLSLTAESDLVAMFDSWIRLASTSVKHALNARLKLWQTWQKQLAALKSVERKRESQGDTWQAEHRDAEMRAEQARREFEDSTKLVGAELIRFEVEKGEDFRLALGAYVDALYKAQTEVSMLASLFLKATHEETDRTTLHLSDCGWLGKVPQACCELHSSSVFPIVSHGLLVSWRTHLQTALPVHRNNHHTQRR